MTIEKVTFQEVREFVSENGYILAVYRKQEDGNWYLTDEVCDNEVVAPDTILLASNIGGNINFNETVTEDKQILFELHNNFNIPAIIPCF